MKISADSVEEYLARLPQSRQAAFNRLRNTILTHLPEGFEETLGNGMIGYVVPHSIYPPGYHCDPTSPLPFTSIASQKNFIALYHMGLYADPALLNWFVRAWPNQARRKLDMGKSCVRFKYLDDIPFDLIADLMSRLTPQDVTALYSQRS